MKRELIDSAAHTMPTKAIEFFTVVVMANKMICFWF